TQVRQGLKIIRQLGADWLQDVLSPATPEGVAAFGNGVEVLYRRLTDRTVLGTPWLRVGTYPRRLTKRQLAQRLPDAVMVCLMKALAAKVPKPLETATSLLEKWELPLRRGGSTIEFVKKRAQRAKGRADDPTDATQDVVRLLELSYADIKEMVCAALGE